MRMGRCKQSRELGRKSLTGMQAAASIAARGDGEDGAGGAEWAQFVAAQGDCEGVGELSGAMKWDSCACLCNPEHVYSGNGDTVTTKYSMHPYLAVIEWVGGPKEKSYHTTKLSTEQ